MGCLFCKLIGGELPAKVVYQNEHVFCFDDINPQAPTHVLVVPKEHHASLNELAEKGEMAILGKMYEAVMEVAKIKGVDETGFRTVINNGPDGGQIIWHLHLHVIGGERLGDDMAG